MKLLHRTCLVGLSLLLLFVTTAWQIEPTGVRLAPAGGFFTGSTNRGFPVSFTVSPNGAQWTNFKLRTNFTAANCGVIGTLQVTAFGPGNIVNNRFSYTSPTYSFTGQFTSTVAATGTYSFNNFRITINIPSPPYVCYYYLTQSGTWTANLPFTISGNAGVANAVVTASGVGGSATGWDGSYSVTVPGGWSGTVTPSKTGYSFSPPSRSYSNVITNRTGQNFIAIPDTHTISGNTGVAGATLSYADNGPKTRTSIADGSYSLPVSYNWSGTVTPTHPCFTFDPPNRSHFYITTDQTSQDYIASFNSGSGCANIDVMVGGPQRGKFGLLPGASTRASFIGVNDGPVQIVSTNSLPLIAAERVIQKFNHIPVSFTEMMGLPNSQLDNTYWLPWYNNMDLDTQLRFANVSGSTATVQLYIGGQEKTSGCTPLNSPYTLEAGASIRISCSGVNGGPVQIVSTQNIVAAERVIYKAAGGTPLSFTEVMALPNKQLSTTYWLPWYNNVDLDTQLRFANVSDQEATVHLFIGGQEKTSGCMPSSSPYTLTAGASLRVSCAGVNAGPVKIESTQNIVAAERLLYKVNQTPTSFSEMMAVPDNPTNTTYWLPWYNNVDLDTQLRFANVSDQPATVRVFIGGQEMTSGCTPSNSPYALAAGASLRVSCAGVNNGPVEIRSDQQLVAAERVIYKANGVNTSFTEMMGLPDGLLDATYWFPWYNNVDLDTQLRFGVP